MGKNLLPCNFQNLGLRCEQLLFGPRAKDAVGQSSGKREVKGILGDLTSKEPIFWALGFLLLGAWGTQKQKKNGGSWGEEEEKRKPVKSQGRLKGRLCAQL